MEVKIFQFSFSPFEFTSRSFEQKGQTEGAINDWLGDNPGIKIRFVTHSFGIHSEISEEGCHWIMILVWYEEEKPPRPKGQF